MAPVASLRKVAASVAAASLAFSVLAPAALAATAGPSHAGTGADAGGGGSAWSNTSFITADDTSYATSTIAVSGTTNALNATNYGFAIPTDAVIDGIAVTIARASSANTAGNSIDDSVVRLLKAGAPVGTNNASSSDWPTSIGTANYGSTSDLWGTTWTAAEINASDFGVTLTALNESGVGTRTASVDYIQVTVTYSLPATVTPATGGTAISNATAGGAYTTLTGPTLAESQTGDIGNGTVILNAPAGFEFDTSASVTALVTRTGGSGADNRNLNGVTSGNTIAATVGASAITLTISDDTDSGVTNSLTWQGIKVRPTSGTTNASGNITNGGTSTLFGIAGGTNFGSLAEVLATTATAVSSNNDPSTYGQSVTLTATVSNGYAPTGIVEFYQGATLVGTGSLNGSYQATYTTNALAAGTHNFTAQYLGDANNNGSTSGAYAQDVNPASLTVTATSTVKNYGDTVTFLGTEFGTAGLVLSDTVSSVTLTSAGAAAGATVAGSPYAIVPSAAVGTGLSNYSISYVNGTLTVNAVALAVAADPQSKNYGDTDPALTVSGTGFVNGEDESVLTGALTRVAGENVGTYPISQGTLAAPANYAMTFSGSNLTINARPLSITTDDVSRQYGTANPTFTASFNSFGFADTVASLGGTLVFTTSATVASPVGAYSVTPSGVTSTNYAITFVSGTLTVTAGSTATSTIVDTPTPNSTVGDSVQLDATVTGYNPTGNVHFYSGATLLGSATVSGATATINHVFTVAGDYTINAEYQGDANNDPSTGTTTVHVVDKDDADTVTTVSSADPAIVGTNVDFTATVTGAYNPTGTVEFYDGATLMGTGALNGSFEASYATSALSVGSHNITAHYLGDGNNNASVSGVEQILVQDIDKDSPSTSTVLSVSNPSTIGDMVTLTADVTGGFGPTGDVEFFANGVSIGTAPLVSGTATLMLNTLAVGSHDLEAEYLGDTNNNASTSPTVTVHVVQKMSSTSLYATILSPNSVHNGVSMTVEVTGYSPTGFVEFYADGVLLGTAALDPTGKANIERFLTIGTHALEAVYLGDLNNFGSSATSSVQIVEFLSSQTSDGGAPLSSGSGRGNGGTNLSSLAAFTAGTYGFTTAPAAFGGDDAPLSDAEIGYVCSMQRALGPAEPEVVGIVAGIMAQYMGRSADYLSELLGDSSLCAGVNASLKDRPAVATNVITLFPIDRKGFPVSSNETWNACLRGSVSLEQIRNNPDRNEYRRAGVSNPLTCGHYRTAGMWKHPDLGVHFTFDRATRRLVLPDGYVGVLNEYAAR